MHCLPWTVIALTFPAGILSLSAQDDFSVLRINEVMSNNATQSPANKKGEFHDLVEIYNGGDTRLSLSELALSDTPDAEGLNAVRVLAIPPQTTIEPRGFVVILLSGDKDIAGDCQTDLELGLDKDGTEPITLWGPRGLDSRRTILDQVWLPPLNNDVSFGRFPDGAGPAPVPIADTWQHFYFFAGGTTTFGVCGTSPCSTFEAPCKGRPNGGPGTPVRPRVNRLGHSSNHPVADEPVRLTARVTDDKEPTPPNIKSVRMRYTVNGATAPIEVEMEYDASAGLQTGAADGQPLDRWTIWNGTIPGQAAGARVEFTFVVEDVDGLTDADPFVLCASGLGPCDELGLPGPGCATADPPSLLYKTCELPFRYWVNFEVPPALQFLVINEVMATQSKTLADGTDFDDYIELYNGGTEALDLAGLWLSDRPFQPQGWQFPAGSRIEPGQYLLVWADASGGQCPRPPKRTGDGQECPDPTDPARASYHTNFALDARGDQVYLFVDRGTGDFGVIHGVEFGQQMLDVSLSLLPDGDRSGSFEPTPAASPGASNGAMKFRRGDSNSDCRADLTDAIFTLRFLFQSGDPLRCSDAADVDDNGQVQLTDAIYLLNYLFRAGVAVPPPGEAIAGPDPTADELTTCEEANCA